MRSAIMPSERGRGEERKETGSQVIQADRRTDGRIHEVHSNAFVSRISREESLRRKS